MIKKQQWFYSFRVGFGCKIFIAVLRQSGKGKQDKGYDVNDSQVACLRPQDTYQQQNSAYKLEDL
jgi:hypothetical protein